MINNVVLTGRLVADPEMKYTKSGVAVANAVLAVNRNFVNADGEREADFIRLIAWQKTAEIMADYLTKGSLVGIQGAIRTRSWEDDDGDTHYVTEVEVRELTFLEGKREQTDDKNKNNKYKNKRRK